MCHAVEESSALDALVERATVVAIGPGLGTDEWAQELLQRILLTDLPLVMDADALNLLAQQPTRRENWVLTPHPGEAARLLGVDSAAVQTDRLAALDELQQRYGGVVVLKGHATLISGSECPWLIRAGNPGMATAGMGDVLTGITAALLAQHALELGSIDELVQIAATAAWVHATTADEFAVHGERGLIASDLLAGLRATLNP
jgi:NAD(P)H-hydrate epimerase